jgi:hypothetical protein
MKYTLVRTNRNSPDWEIHGNAICPPCGLDYEIQEVPETKEEYFLLFERDWTKSISRVYSVPSILIGM